jgi:hypothetical protein
MAAANQIGNALRVLGVRMEERVLIVMTDSMGVWHHLLRCDQDRRRSGAGHHQRHGRRVRFPSGRHPRQSGYGQRVGGSQRARGEG